MDAEEEVFTSLYNVQTNGQPSTINQSDKELCMTTS